LTGLLGINVGGMPGVENPWAFAAVAAAIVLMAVFEIWLLKRLRWI
jgi:zinc transporter